MARRPFSAHLLAVLIALTSGGIINAQRTQTSNEAKFEATLETSRRTDPGIALDEPKVYDDAMLQQMLRAAEARLATIQALDQTGILSRIGAISGATQRISSVGVSLQTPQIPGLSSVARTGGTTTTTTATDSVSTDGKPSSSDVTATAATGPSQDVTTTTPAFGPPTATAPAPSTSMPSGFSVSASDALNEQMQLMYEIANLRLLLEGAVSDHVLVKGDKTYIKPRVTLGFPITINGDRFEDAVAIVEVEVEKGEAIVPERRPVITALLPREKTYNVAAITDSSMSIGGGVATSVIGVSGNWLTGRKTYYVTQDQDTVALTFQPADAARIGFRWQFRPVLGRRFVRSGLKQTFVQLAFPAELSTTDLGKLQVRTYWLKFDRKKGTTSKVVTGSVREYAEHKIEKAHVASSLLDFSTENLHDLGAGQMLVDVPGRFLAGTYLRIGATILREGSGASFDTMAVKFTAPIADIATKGVAIVARDGTETPLTIETDKAGVPTAASARVTGLDDGNVRLTVTVDKDVSKLKPAPILIVGNRVFGYADAPVDRNQRVISVTVPMSLVLTHPTVVVTSLFASYRLEAPVANVTALSRGERLVLLEQGAASSRFLLYGNRMSTIKVIEPTGVAVADIGRAEDADTLKLITLTPAQLRSHKQLVLQRDSERPFLLAMPPGERAPTMKPRERLIVTADAVTFDADAAFENPVRVVWRNVELKAERLDARTLRVSGLRAAGVTALATSETLEFTFTAGKSVATIEVVTQKVETVPRIPGAE